MFQAALRADVDLTDSVTLTSLTSYVYYDQKQRAEGDGLTAISLDLVKNDGTIKSFAQELRLSNGGGSAVRWVAGANRSAEHTSEFQSLMRISYVVFC